MTAFSNGLLTIDEVVKNSKLNVATNDLINVREELRGLIMDTLAADTPFENHQIRQIHGAILKAKLATIRFQIEATGAK